MAIIRRAGLAAVLAVFAGAPLAAAAEAVASKLVSKHKCASNVVIVDTL